MSRKTCRFPLFDGCPDDRRGWKLRSRELEIPAGALDARLEWVLPKLIGPPFDVSVMARAQTESNGRAWRVVASACWSLGAGEHALPPGSGPIVCVELHIGATAEFRLAADLVYEVEEQV